jgi:hypothetical protein
MMSKIMKNLKKIQEFATPPVILPVKILTKIKADEIEEVYLEDIMHEVKVLGNFRDEH